MVDFKALDMELAFARRARREAQMAGLDLERVIERMQAGCTLQQIELEELASFPVSIRTDFAPRADETEFRQAA
ncbi:hypothetical protein [Pseudorhodoplanes sp.]|uniref:hypothetical protein n=1 Tax=Pseudorhodoplanes sp. TaxID=1934341 RepID=UPI002BE8B855|nr:hypothetical protein [Pseudorhodoplanes sp.]HWV51375.1 hypothetical protein [Pseudorhodoplanes sp.]